MNGPAPETPPCPLCGHRSPFVFLNRPSMPAHQHLLYDTPEAARACPRGDLVMAACPDCGFAFNAALDPDLLDYCEAYDNDQGRSPAFRQHMEEMADRISRGDRLSGRNVVEVGCGKGGFLELLSRRPEIRAQGFDPSYVGPEAIAGGRVCFHKRFFDPESLTEPAGALICRHVLEHIPSPPNFLSGLKACMEPGGAAFFETPDVDWILENRVIWDFFYEHCSLFSRDSLARALDRAGFSEIRVSRVFDGQYLLAEAVAGGGPGEPGSGPGPVAFEAFRTFKARAREEEQRLVRRLQDLAEKARAGLWGAGAKGVTLANLADPGGDLLDLVVDINPNKQGRFLAGTGHPIVSPEEAARRGVALLAVMNPRYLAECRDMVERIGADIHLVRLENAQDGGGNSGTPEGEKPFSNQGLS